MPSGEDWGNAGQFCQISAALLKVSAGPHQVINLHGVHVSREDGKPSQNPSLMVRPVTIFEKALIEFACGQTGQFSFKVNGSRTLLW